MSKDKDYISREEALSYPFANGKYDKKNASMEFIFGCEAYKEWLEGLPTVKDIRSKGHWIKHENYTRVKTYTRIFTSLWWCVGGRCVEKVGAQQHKYYTKSILAYYYGTR